MKESVYSFRFDYGDALFRLYQFSISNGENDSPFPLHGHQFYELHIALGGSYSYLIEGKSILLREGQMLLLPPGTSHLAVDPDFDSYSYTALSFSLTRQDGEGGCFAYFKSTLESAANTPITIPASLSALAKELDEIIDTSVSVGSICAYKAKASAFIYELFDSLNDFRAERIPVRPSQDTQDRLVLLETLVNQPNRRIDEIAEAINYSPRHTARLIHSIYGMSLSDIRKSQKQEGNPKKR